jgi:hypothetical protein
MGEPLPLLASSAADSHTSKPYLLGQVDSALLLQCPFKGLQKPILAVAATR